MIEVDEAIERIVSKCRPLEAHSVPVSQTLRLVLAEEVISDVDSPPHDKTLVDGFAICMHDAVAGRELVVLERVVAGQVPTIPISPGRTSHVMTGAPLPEGTEAMVMVEQTVSLDDQRVQILAENVQTNQFIMNRGTVFARNEIVMARGTAIGPAEVGLLCEVGRTSVRCVAQPRVAILPTGDELVEFNNLPGRGQIRNSNGPMLEACAHSAGAQVVSLGIGRDDTEQLRRLMAVGLESDILIVSGGVSAGALDLVPPTLRSLGVCEVFHKVRVKPGKPIWFGTFASHGRECLVFGLPGNPVSSLVCFQLFVRPAIDILAGNASQSATESLSAQLTDVFMHRGDRTTFYPGRRRQLADQLNVTPLPWLGSADLRGLVHANCLIRFQEPREYQRGDQVATFPLP